MWTKPEVVVVPKPVVVVDEVAGKDGWFRPLLQMTFTMTA